MLFLEDLADTIDPNSHSVFLPRTPQKGLTPRILSLLILLVHSWGSNLSNIFEVRTGGCSAKQLVTYRGHTISADLAGLGGGGISMDGSWCACSASRLQPHLQPRVSA
eukprot:4263314-Amphidinium_carterae.1